VLLASRIPVQIVSAWLQERLGFHLAGAQAAGPEKVPDPPAPPEATVNRNTVSQSSVYSQLSSGSLPQQPHLPRSAFSDISPNPGQTSSMRSPPAYEIWHPPPPAYEDSMASGSTAPSVSGLPASGTVDDAWRQYPAFPSAYPVTPAPPSPKLPSLATAPASIAALFPIESEEEVPDLPQPPKKGARSTPQPQPMTAPEWDFERSLQDRPEHPNPSSVSDWSDDDHMTGVQQTVDDHTGDCKEPAEHAMAVDSSDEEIEDDFDVTLRTPPPRLATRRRVGAQLDEIARPISVAIDSRSTSLTTIGNRLSALPDTTEESGASGTENAPPPTLVGAKRPLPRAERSEMVKRSRIAAASKVRAPPARARKVPAARSLKTAYSGDASGEQTTDERGASFSDRKPHRHLAKPSENRGARGSIQPCPVIEDKGVQIKERKTRASVPPRAAGTKASSGNSASDRPAGRNTA
jgi:hypothetical protein